MLLRIAREADRGKRARGRNRHTPSDGISRLSSTVDFSASCERRLGVVDQYSSPVFRVSRSRTPWDKTDRRASPTNEVNKFCIGGGRRYISEKNE